MACPSMENSTRDTCGSHKSWLLEGAERCDAGLSFLVPKDCRIWEERSLAWNLTFKISVGLLALLFLLLGLLAVVMVIRKDSLRLQLKAKNGPKTFYAVYTCIAILCFSRFLLLALDPYGIIGFISQHFRCWIIISRLLSLPGFPSLVASYTLVFLTLVKLSAASLQTKHWYHQWKYVISVALVPYVIATAGEAISHASFYPALLTVLVCESLFTLWGAIVSVTFLFTGNRLLRKIRMLQAKSVRVSHDHTSGPSEDTLRQVQSHRYVRSEYQRRIESIRNSIRKIVIITFVTAIISILYSLTNATNLTLLSLLVYDCLGFMGRRGHPDAWLTLMIMLRFLELMLVVNMLYSVTDAQQIIAMLTCHHCGAEHEQATAVSGRPRTATTERTINTSSVELRAVPSPRSILHSEEPDARHVNQHTILQGTPSDLGEQEYGMEEVEFHFDEPD